MRTLLITCFLLLGVCCAAQELVGPDRTLPGTLASFEIVPEQAASWHIVTPSSSVNHYQIDGGLSKLYFASPELGHYTVIAGIVIDGRPKLLVKTFMNGGGIPLPPSSLEAWITAQVKSNAAESRLVAESFEQIVWRIESENIRTAQNARTQLQITLTGALALASPTAVTDWMPFLTELSRQIEQELGDNINDLTAVKAILQKVANAMKAQSDLGTPQTVDTPSTRTPGTHNRILRNSVSR